MIQAVLTKQIDAQRRRPRRSRKPGTRRRIAWARTPRWRPSKTLYSAFPTVTDAPDTQLDITEVSTTVS